VTRRPPPSPPQFSVVRPSFPTREMRSDDSAPYGVRGVHRHATSHTPQAKSAISGPARTPFARFVVRKAEGAGGACLSHELLRRAVNPAVACHEDGAPPVLGLHHRPMVRPLRDKTRQRPRDPAPVLPLHHCTALAMRAQSRSRPVRERVRGGGVHALQHSRHTAVRHNHGPGT